VDSAVYGSAAVKIYFDMLHIEVGGEKGAELLEHLGRHFDI
jgi:hypothetical protein